MKEHSLETGATVVAKIGPPASVSLATIAGYPVSEIVLWATLIYTVLLIGQKLTHIWREFKGGKNVQ